MKTNKASINAFGIALLVLIMLLSLSSFAIPNSLTLQGRLTNTAGTAQQGTFNFTFAIYDNTTGGNKLWDVINQSVTTDANGIYDAILTGINLSFADQLYLGISVQGENESVPRINLTSTPYSFRANVSEGLNQNNTYRVTNLNVSNAFVANNTLFVNGSLVGIGTTSPNDVLEVIGNVRVSGSFNATFINASEIRIGRNPVQEEGIAYKIVNFTSNLQTQNGSLWNRSSANIYVRFVDDLVGIGTATPDNRLTISGTDTDANLAVPGILHLNITDSYNNSATNFITLDHYLNAPSNASSALTAGGIGLGILFRATNNDSELVNVSFINATLVNARNGSEASALTFYTRIGNAGLVPKLILNGSDVYIAPTTGNVGIGTTSPSTKLDVNGDVALQGDTVFQRSAASLGQLSIGGLSADGPDTMRIFTNNVERIRIDSSGNLGINTTTPAQTLTVQGTFNATSSSTQFLVNSNGDVVINLKG